MSSATTNNVVASTVRNYFYYAVAYFLNSAARNLRLSADDDEDIEVGPKRVHIDDAFDAELFLSDVVLNNGPQQPQQYRPMRHLVLKRNNTIIGTGFADEYVPPSTGDNFTVSEEIKATNRSLNITFFSTLHGDNRAAGPHNNIRRLRTSINPALKKAGDHVFSLPQSMTEMREPESDSDSSDGSASIRFSDTSDESSASDTDIDIDIDNLDVPPESQEEEKKGEEETKDEEEVDEEKLKKEFPVADVIFDQPYCRIGKVLILSPSVRVASKRSRDDDDEEPSADIPEKFSTPEDDLPRPTRYHRQRRRTNERRHVEVEGSLVDPLREALKGCTDLFKVQEKPSDVRMAYLGRDGLDDAPTPPASPSRKRMRLDL